MNNKGTITLETDRLVLRKFTVDDVEDMFNNWASNLSVTRFMTWKPYTNKNDVKHYIDMCIDDYCNFSTYNWCIEFRENKQAIGSIGSVCVRDDIKAVAIGYCLSEKYWHMCIMTEAFKRVIKFFFEEIGANRIEATHDANNLNSGKVMLKSGLKYEGIRRQAEVNNCGICDSVLYAILSEDYFNALCQ